MYMLKMNDTTTNTAFRNTKTWTSMEVGQDLDDYLKRQLKLNTIRRTETQVAAAFNRKLITARPGTLALPVPSDPTVTVAALMSCVLSVYHAFTSG